MIAILTFHGLGIPPRSLETGEDSVWLDGSSFRSVLDAVRDRPDVRITFDDGNLSDLTVALPELLRRGMTARFFVCTGRIDHRHFLDQSALRELLDAGMTIGSHGHDHVPWRRLRGMDADREWSSAKDILENVIGRPVGEAACPFGSYGHRALRGLRSAGFATVLTSDRLWASEHAWLQPRFTLRKSDGPAEVTSWLKRPGVIGRWMGRSKVFIKSMQ